MFAYAHIQQSLNFITIYKDNRKIKSPPEMGGFFMQQLFSSKLQLQQSKLP
jgi:hypothetical protein